MNEHDRYMFEHGLCELRFPITCESRDLDGNWILVDLLAYLGNNKWQALDEDGNKIIVDARHCSNPRL